MKDVIEEQRQVLLKLMPTNSPEDWSDAWARKVESQISESFNKIQNEADYIVSHLNGDAGRLEVAAPQLRAIGGLLRKFAKSLRYYASRIESSEAVANESNLIVLPRNGLEPMDDG